MGFLEQAKPYVAMTSLQFCYAGMNIITKVSFNRGMNHFVLVVYRHAVATVALAPFAFFFERKIRPKMTFSVFLKIFVLGLLGPVLDQNFYYLGLKRTSPTFACALSNLLPAMAFVMALMFRMEKVDLKQARSIAKIVGTVVCVGGAMLMALYKGPVMPMLTHHSLVSFPAAPAPAPAPAQMKNDQNLIKGSLMLVAATLAWASLFIVQAETLKTYPAPLSVTALMCFMGTLQATAISAGLVRNSAKWALHWDIDLLTVVYSGIATSAVAYYVQGLCMRLKGPVFPTAFTPLMMIIAAIMSSIILAEKIHLGSVIGGALIAGGLYAVLWGKAKDHKLSSSAKSINSCDEGQELDSKIIKSNAKMEDLEAAKGGIAHTNKPPPAEPAEHGTS